MHSSGTLSLSVSQSVSESVIHLRMMSASSRLD